MALDVTQIWDESADEPKRPGVTAAEIEAWEKEHGVTLPSLLRDLLALQDGGQVKYEPIRVVTLEEMVPPDEEFWHWAVIEAEEVRNRDWVIAFAWGDDEPQYLLNFNANGPHGEPTVYSWYHDPGDMRIVASTLAEFFGGVLATSETPAVDWTETMRLDVVLFQERIDFGDQGGDEYVLGRQNGILVLFTRDLEGKVLSKTSIPEPVSSSMEEFRPSPGRTFALNLESDDSDRMLSIESTRMSDGTWKNRTDRGGVYAIIESRDRKTLQALRESIVGVAKVKKEDREAWWWTWVWTPLIIVCVVVPCLPCFILILIAHYTMRLVYLVFRGRPSPESPPAPSS